jgi:hypothetical protein
LVASAHRAVEEAVERFRVAELVRAMATEAVARDLAVASPPTLEQLAAAAPPPWDDILTAHREALVSSARSVAALADANERLSGLSWQGWQAGAAVGTGTYVQNTPAVSVQSGLAHQFGAAIDLGGAGTAARRLAVPAHGQIRNELRLDPPDGIQHHHARGERHPVFVLRAIPRLATEDAEDHLRRHRLTSHRLPPLGRRLRAR